MILAGSLASGAALLTPDLRLMISTAASRRSFISMNGRLSAIVAFLNHAVSLDKNVTAAGNIRFVQTIMARSSHAFTCRWSNANPPTDLIHLGPYLISLCSTAAKLRQIRVEG